MVVSVNARWARARASYLASYAFSEQPTRTPSDVSALPNYLAAVSLLAP
jgi:hypothetical protein